MKKLAIISIAVIALMVSSMAATVLAQTTYSIYIKNPNDSANGALGVSNSGHWVGQIPITLTSGGTSTDAFAYCMQADRGISIGGTYTATLTTVADSAIWRAASYVLSWYAPTTNNEAAVDQAAIWHILNPTYVRESWMDVTIDNAGIARAAIASGKDVVRSTDHLNWIAPVTSNGASTNGNPGQTITFISQLTDSSGSPRPNVKIQFSASRGTLQLNSTYVSTFEAFTNSQGIAQVNVKVPSDTALGSTVSVQASTRSVWPQVFIDLTSDSNQDLLGIDTALNLTVSTNVCILAYIMVLPESALGALGAVVAFAAAFAIFKVKRQKTAPMMP